MAQQQERRRVGPVSVLDHHHQWCPPANGRQQLGDRRVEPVAFGVGVGSEWCRELAHQLGEVGQQARELAAFGTERAAQSWRDRSRARVDRAPRRTAGTDAAPPSRRRHTGQVRRRQRPRPRTRGPGGSSPSPPRPRSARTSVRRLRHAESAAAGSRVRASALQMETRASGVAVRASLASSSPPRASSQI